MVLRIVNVRSGHRVRQGLTLLELVVVLTILVAIGALLVPMLPNMIHRSNIASCVVNIAEMDKLVQTYSNLYAEYPDKLDNLATSASKLASYVANGAGGDYGASFEAGTMTANDKKALKGAGITTLCVLKEDQKGDWKPTFWPYSDDMSSGPSTVSVDDASGVAVVTDVGARLMGLPYTANYRYVTFGVNAPCTLFRNLAAEPAYHFADTPSEDPATYYMCLGLVFAVAVEGDGVDADGKPTKVSKALEHAKYMGCVAYHDFGFSTAGMHTKEWWERLKSERPLK
jgi:type II secretory pathway pseudopilin PulG